MKKQSAGNRKLEQLLESRACKTERSPNKLINVSRYNGAVHFIHWTVPTKVRQGKSLETWSFLGRGEI